MNYLKIYKSSAGSGKTFTLVKEYLRIVLANPEDYRHILAITFTNKAAGEMKSRIIESLVEMSNGLETGMQKVLAEELPGIDLVKRSARILNLILHDYNGFSVSTIDSFFQRILRALAREMHLPLNMDVEINLDDAIEDVTERLFSEMGKDEELTQWMSELILQKMDDEKGWSVEKDIEQVARELFRERPEERKQLARIRIREIYSQLKKLRKEFETTLRTMGREAELLIEQSGFSIEDFSYKRTGVAGFFSKMSTLNSPDELAYGSRVETALSDSSAWLSKSSKMKDAILPLVEDELLPRLQKIVTYIENNKTAYTSAFEALKRIFLFGIANDLLEKFAAYRKDNKVFLLADTPRMLSEIISDQDAPFIYEKVGNQFKHLLIDEFQDTSQYQWQNLLPLIINSLGSGNLVMVVGDAKQSIYRWRGGNMQLLVEGIGKDLKNFSTLFRENILDSNYRSRRDIIRFNNQFFENLPNLFSNEEEFQHHPLLGMAYGTDLLQKVSPKNDRDGFVRIEFLEKSSEQEDGEKQKWKDEAMQHCLDHIHAFMKRGYRYKDIAILTRSNQEGNTFANFLFEHGIDKIISPDSLLISAAPQVRFLLSCIRYLHDTSDAIAAAEIIHYWSKYLNDVQESAHVLFSTRARKKSGKKEVQATLFETGNLEDNLFNKILPLAFTGQISSLSKLPVYQLSEELIKIFNLHKKPDAFLQRFQDLLLEYSAKNNSSLKSFLEWWEFSPSVNNCSVIIPESEDAIRIMTIHKSKGLQFPIVMIPFADWKLLPRANDIMWVGAEQEPYQEMGKLAVLMSKRLSDTYFKKDYEEEVSQTLVDNLNLLYVAFTRAEEQLIIYCPKDDAKSLNSVSKLIYRNLMALGADASTNVYIQGDENLTADTKQKESLFRTVQLEHYPIHPWQKKISISTRAATLLAFNKKDKEGQKNFGIIVHELLSKSSGKEAALQNLLQYRHDGLIGQEEANQIKELLKKMFSVKEIAELFDPKWTILAEREILCPDGSKLRPDRVLVSATETRIIDFKTGKAASEHRDQVLNYASTLKDMGYKNIRPFLLYLNKPELIEFSNDRLNQAGSAQS